MECEDKMLDILNGAGIVEAKIWCANADELERSFTESDLDLKDKSVAAFCLTRNAHHY